MGGLHVLGYQLIRIIKNDLVVFGGAIAAMICLILFKVFRRIRWVIIPVICCGCSALATMGLFGFLGFKPTVISSNFIALQLILRLALATSDPGALRRIGAEARHSGVLAARVEGLFLLDVENSFINYFRERTTVHKDLSFIDRQLGGSTPLDIVYTIPGAERKKDLIMTAETVQLLQRIQHAMQQHKAVGKILSLVNFTEVAKEVKKGKTLPEYQLTAIYWTMEDALREELLRGFFAPEHAKVRFSVRIKDTTEGLDRTLMLAQKKLNH